MIKAFLLLFEPVRTWDGIARARRGVVIVFFTYLLPMIVLCGLAEGYGLVKFGKPRYATEDSNILSVLTTGGSAFLGLQKLPPAEAAVYEVLQSALTIVVILAASYTLKALGETFHGRHTFAQAFSTIVYGLSPLFVLRLLDTFSGVSPWTTWIIGILLSVAVLYHGVPRVMLPDPPHAFGLYLMNCLQLILATGIARAFTSGILAGRFTVVDGFISKVAGWLPF